MTSSRSERQMETLDDVSVRNDCVLNDGNYSTLDEVAIRLPSGLLHIVLVHNLDILSDSCILVNDCSFHN